MLLILAPSDGGNAGVASSPAYTVGVEVKMRLTTTLQESLAMQNM